MKWIFRWFWHGKDVGPRIWRVILGYAAVLTAQGFKWPTSREEWVQLGAAGLMASVGALSRQSDSQDQPNA